MASSNPREAPGDQVNHEGLVDFEVLYDLSNENTIIFIIPAS